MFRLMVVDDERWIRERIARTIDWRKINVEVVAEAVDGEEAKALAKSLRPDIILTDIRMPCIDGLELTQQLQNEKIDSKIIIISGFSDFAFAQKAVKLGAFDYLLKPVEEDDLLAIVKRCTQQIQRVKNRDRLLQSAQVRILETLPQLKENFFLNLISNNFISEERTAGELAYYGIHNRGFHHICFVVQLDLAEQIQEDIHSVQYVLCNIIRDFCSRLGDYEVLVAQEGEVACVISADKPANILERQTFSVCGGVKKIFSRIMGHTVTAGIGKVCEDLLDISSSYRQARQALLYKAYLGNDSIYDSADLDGILRRQARPCRQYNTDLLVNQIKIGNLGNALDCVDKLIEDTVGSRDDLHPIDIKMTYIGILVSVLRVSVEHNASVEIASYFDLEFFNRMSTLTTVDEMRTWLRQTVERIVTDLQSSGKSSVRKIIKLALNYIHANYSRTITLNDIAGEVFLNPSYFCKIFKQEMGESFTHYLMKYRIQKAVELMDDPHLKIYEIAAMVGYSDVQYFTRIFKSVQGMVPTSYREKIG